jgi:hypothetical protein
MPETDATRQPRPSHITKEHDAMVQRNLEILAAENPASVRSEVEIYKEKLAETPPSSKREQYAALATHREMATTILAAGGTFDEAADWAGVTRSTVSGWYADADFRKRVEEQRSVVQSKIRGRIESWMDRRTADPQALDNADPRTTLAIYDRISGPSGGRAGQGTQQPVTVNVALSYSELMERAISTAGSAETAKRVDDASQEGSDFPLLERETAGGLPGPTVAGGGPSSD